MIARKTYSSVCLGLVRSKGIVYSNNCWIVLNSDGLVCAECLIGKKSDDIAPLYSTWIFHFEIINTNNDNEIANSSKFRINKYLQFIDSWLWFCGFNIMKFYGLIFVLLGKGDLNVYDYQDTNNFVHYDLYLIYNK